MKKILSKLSNFKPSPKTSVSTKSRIQAPTSSTAAIHVILPDEGRQHAISANPLNKSIIDIVLIHGSAAHYLDSFTDRNTGICWVRDLLPQDLQEGKQVDSIRVLSFSWNNEMRMEDTVHGFIRDFGEVRRTTETETRPIVFIVHSMGGLILQSVHAGVIGFEETICHSNGTFDEIRTPIKALFFGSPEKYFKQAASILSSLDSTEGGSTADSDTASPFFRDMKFLGVHTRAFNELIKDGESDIFDCQYFLEGSGGLEQNSVSEEEIQALPHQRRIQLSKGHGPIIRYTGVEEPDYKRILICVQASLGHLLDETVKENV